MKTDLSCHHFDSDDDVITAVDHFSESPRGPQEGEYVGKIRVLAFLKLTLSTSGTLSVMLLILT